LPRGERKEERKEGKKEDNHFNHLCERTRQSTTEKRKEETRGTPAVSCEREREKEKEGIRWP
jgi:hypothetical protein